ncbi:MAG TPA: AMP-binding protein [Aldersonia sp.]
MSDSQPHVVCGDRRRSHLEVHDRANRLAAAIRESGIGRGERVGMVLRNDIEFLEVSLAAAACGANPVPINWHWREREIAHVLCDSGARLVFAHSPHVPDVEAALVSIGGGGTVVEVPMLQAHTNPAAVTGRHETLDDWISRASEPLPYQEGAIADSMGMIYTSGTTGRPKGVLRDRMTTQQLLSIAAGTAQRMGLRPGGTMMVAGPLYHTSPNALALLALRMGTDIVVMPRFDPRDFLTLVEQHRVEQVKVVPTMLSRLLSLTAAVRANYDVSSLTHVIHSAAPCPPAVKRAAIDWFGDAVIEFFGCTEAGTITWITAGEWLRRPGSVGRPVDGARVEIRDSTGRECAPDEIGQVWVRGADYWPRFHYVNTPSENGGDDLVHVGDLGYVDAEGYLWLTGRSSEVVISGGVNIYPAEIENVIAEHAGVEDVAVFGVADEDLGQKPVAHVVLRPHAVGTTGDDIRAYLDGKLARYKVPAVVEVVDELPREDTGKVFKAKLVALHDSAVRH